jgi:hypothetical protein
MALKTENTENWVRRSFVLAAQKTAKITYLDVLNVPK